MRFAGEYLPLARHSFRVLVGCWLLVAVVLVNSYSCIVVSSLTVPTVHPAINSLENLAASNDVSLIIRKDYALGQQILAIINKICIFHIFFLFVICHKFQSANSGIFKTLGDQVRQHPDRILSTASETVQKLETGRYAFPYVRMYLLHA